MKNLNILIINDSEPILHGMSRCYSLKGHIVKSALSLDESIKFHSKDNWNPDIILCDRHLDNDVVERYILNKLREIWPSSFIIIHTALSGNVPNLINDIKKKGADMVLVGVSLPDLDDLYIKLSYSKDSTEA